jgi:hypothetical protein
VRYQELSLGEKARSIGEVVEKPESGCKLAAEVWLSESEGSNHVMVSVAMHQ